MDGFHRLRVDGCEYEIFLPNRDTDYIQGKIAVDDAPYELEMLRDMASRLSAGDLVLDVGANVGNHTLYLASVVAARVAAFEPNSDLCDAIEKSVKKNRIEDRVHVHCLGVGDATAKAHFTELNEENLGAQSLHIGDGDENVISVIRLDDMSFDQPVAALKVDVEGMELAVLKGAAKLLQEQRPLLYVECRTELEFRTTQPLLQEHGYSYWDTFNATPTHLFVHSSRVTDKDRVERLMTKIVRNEYEFEDQIKLLRTSLAQANRKYREASERIVTLRKELDLAQHDRKEMAERLNAHIGALESERESLEKNLERTEEAGRELESRVGVLESECESLKKSLERTEEARRELESKMGTLESERESLEKSLESSDKARRELDTRLRHLRAGHRVLMNEKEALLSSHDSSLRERDRLRSLLVESESSLEVISEKFQEESGRADRLEKSARDAKDALSREQKQREFLSTQLEKANLKYRRTTQQMHAIRRSRAYRTARVIGNARNSWRSMIKLPWRLLRVLIQRPNERKHAADVQAERSATEPGGALKPKSEVGALSSDVRFSTLKQTRVACIMDDFTLHSFSPECRLFQLTPEGWEQQLEDSDPQILFVESAWRGCEERWDGKVAHRAQELQDIVTWCRRRRIPTVFWNKEDPIHFQTFLNTAQMFDYVFTVDIDCVHRYKAALEHERVYLLPFACQPAVHNPIEAYHRKDAFCFAGAYYARYPERTRDLGNFIKNLPDFRPVEIYDRNHGDTDTRYKFPEAYQPYIVGSLPFEEIDKAYKGYRYAINLNSIKHSQSMFARRVFELLGSNTVTVSNYSRGLRLLFGDLVLASDDGGELIRRLKSINETDKQGLRKLRLMALRKVLLEHTYQDRLAYIIAKLKSMTPPNPLPKILVFGHAESMRECEELIGHFHRQNYANKEMLIVVENPSLVEQCEPTNRIRFASEHAIAQLTMADISGSTEWVAGLVASDYYGPNYLIDLALATRYSSSEVIGKAAFYNCNVDSHFEYLNPDREYRCVERVPNRSAMQHLSRVADLLVLDMTSALKSSDIVENDIQAIDGFSYCRIEVYSNVAMEKVSTLVDDMPGLDKGLTLKELVRKTDDAAVAIQESFESPTITGDNLATYFNSSGRQGYEFEIVGDSLKIESTLEDGKHDYIYATRDFKPEELGFWDHAAFHLDVSPGLNIQMVLLFLGSNRKRIGAEVRSANRNHDVNIPKGSEFVRLGLRVYGSGSATINDLVLGHKRLDPAVIIGCQRYLLITNHYPSYDDLYRNAFVHTRVKAYREHGVGIDVFRFDAESPVRYHEFQNIDVVTGSGGALRKVLESGQYLHVLVHFLTPEMWEVLREFADEIPITIWLHGVEIQPWYRRKFNYSSEEKILRAKEESARRMAFWEQLLKPIHPNLHLIFVSNIFAVEVMKDLGVTLPESHYTVLNNPINTDLFVYSEKPKSLRMRVLSIRPFSSRVYANDLTIACILELSDWPVFDEMEFLIVGDGPLFDEVVSPIRDFPNVTLKKGFLTQSEIAQLHGDYGIFLCPSRGDTQGVSRDEAMASGLVPVTTSVGAIPEFVDEYSGEVVAPEDAGELARAIVKLVDEPELFLKKSKAAAQRVRQERGASLVIPREIQLIKDRAVIPNDSGSIGRQH